MKQQAGEMMAGRIEAIDRAIRHVRDPGQRMPIAGVAALQCPEHAGPREAAINMGVVENVFSIINVDELIGENGPIAEQCQGNKEQPKPKKDTGVFGIQGALAEEVCPSGNLLLISSICF